MYVCMEGVIKGSEQCNSTVSNLTDSLEWTFAFFCCPGQFFICFSFLKECIYFQGKQNILKDHRMWKVFSISSNILNEVFVTSDMWKHYQILLNHFYHKNWHPCNCRWNILCRRLSGVALKWSIVQIWKEPFLPITLVIVSLLKFT